MQSSGNPVGVQQPAEVKQVSGHGAIAPETDELLRKWLKIQISQFYFGIVIRLVLFVLFVGSIIFSTVTLAPIIEKQIGLLQNLQSSLGSVVSGGPEQENKNINYIELISKLSPEEKQIFVQELQRESGEEESDSGE